MFSLYRLELKTMVKSPSIMMPLVFPVILAFFYSTALTSTGQITAQNGYIILISMSGLSSGLMGFGFRFMNLKTSVLLRRIGASSLTKSQVLTACALSGLTLLCFQLLWSSTLWTSLSALDFGQFGSVSEGFAGNFHWIDVNYRFVIPGFILLVFSSYTVGIMFLGISRNTNEFQMYVNIFFLLAMFLVILIPSLRYTWLHYIAWFLPMFWAVDLMNMTVETMELQQILFDVFIAFGMSTTAFIIGVKTLKFS